MEGLFNNERGCVHKCRKDYANSRNLYWICGSQSSDLLGCNALLFGRNPPTFWRNVSSPSSGTKSKPRKKTAIIRRQVENTGDTVLRNVGGLLPKYTALQSRRSYSSIRLWLGEYVRRVSVEFSAGIMRTLL
jgi:hypothetical protein